MKIERLLLILILASVILKYLWANYGWGGQFLMMFPVLFCTLALLGWYYYCLSDLFYKIVLIYFALFIVSIMFNILEWKGRGLLLFIGSLGFILFPVSFFLRRKKMIHRNIFKFSLLLLLVMVVQTFVYLFVPSDLILTLGHMLSFLIVILAAAILYKGEFQEETSEDEKKIVTFIIIVNILSLLGITFKESFYYFIWI